jgi:hypothetical protein
MDAYVKSGRFYQGAGYFFPGAVSSAPAGVRVRRASRTSWANWTRPGSVAVRLSA